MLKQILILFLVLTISGCARASPGTRDTALTPYLTKTPPPAPEATNQPPPAAETAVPLPTSTPTPIIHTVALGETISSIALRYGLDMGAVQAANPDAGLLIVGMELVIPQGETDEIGGVPVEPLELDVGDAACTGTAEGGLWCRTPVKNPLDQPAGGITISFALETGGDTRSQTVPTLLGRLEPGDTIPASTYFSGPIGGDYSISAELVSALPVEDTGEIYLPAEAVNTQVDTGENRASVFSEVNVSGEAGEAILIRFGAAALDFEGNIVGVRRTELPTELEPGNSYDFNLTLYAAEGEITDVRIYTEAVINSP